MPSPDSSSYTSTVTLTGIRNIDALIEGDRWGGGSGVTITYSFPWQNGASAWFLGPNGRDYSSDNEHLATYHFGLNAIQKAAASSALQCWANVANINFSETPDTRTSVGDIRFAFTSTPEIEKWWGWAGYPNSYWSNGGDIWINSKYGTDADWRVGSNNFESLLHEIGHALGLKHPFSGLTTLPLNLDNALYTVMSYTDAPNSLYPNAGYVNGEYTWLTYRIRPQTPMVIDILAIQSIYGANTSFNSGDDVYTFDPKTPFMKTIWDGGGIDTIDCSNFSFGCSIDLTPGSYSSLMYPPPSNPSGATPTFDGTNDLGIAYNCWIENCTGGFGPDTISGNNLKNVLAGGPGNDTITGGLGNDTIDGGAGDGDQAVYGGKFSDYSITYDGTTSALTFTDKVSGRDGVDQIRNVEGFKFSDGVRTSSSIRVFLNTNVPPVSANLSVTTAEDTTVSGKLPDASDPNGDSVTYLKAADPSNGKVTVTTAGAYTYTPAKDFNGQDAFTFSVSDGKGGINTYTVSITITPVNDAPILAKFIPDQTATSSRTFIYSLPKGTFTDVDSPVLTYTATLSNGSPLPAWLAFDATTQTFRGTPIYTDAVFSTYFGASSIKVTVSDGSLSATGLFALGVVVDKGAADASPVYVFKSSKVGLGINPASYSYFYTTNADERASILSHKDWPWVEQTVTFEAAHSDPVRAVPVYRFWSDKNQSHFFTINTAEKDQVIAWSKTGQNGYDWKYEGPAFSVYADGKATDQSGKSAIPVYRIWMDDKDFNASNGMQGGHFYTADKTVYDSMIKLVGVYGEGVAFYGEPPGA